MPSCESYEACVQVLEPAALTSGTRVGDVTLRRERWVVDALHHRVFMLVTAIRKLFRVSFQHDRSAVQSFQL